MAWLGVDTGGTFTDFVWYFPESAELVFGKVPSNATAPRLVFKEGQDRLGHALSEAARLVHGTTIVTNAVLENEGARVATVTTAGFRDLLEIGRQNRFEMYNLKTIRVKPLSPRRWRFEVAERILWDGTVERQPSEEEVAELIAELERQDVEAVAVCCVFSFVNPENEQFIADRLRARGHWYVTSSNEIARLSREYERFSTTVINGFVGPRVAHYLDDLSHYLTEENVDPDHTFLVSTSGGAMTWETARRLPVNLLNSGPAGGVQGAVEVSKALGISDFITYDMGGTSTDVCLIKDRVPTVTSEGFIDTRPFVVPKLDIVTIGAGGGSVAWVDVAGELQVGPRSAGAHPGPACYGLGGTEPSVTDADLLLGRLSEARALGGSVVLDAAAAAAAVERIRLSFPNLTGQALAEGIIRLAVAKMTAAIREVSVARGLDPREFVLFAYGGAGPMHATEVAVELDIPKVVIPPAPGNFSALGLIMSDVRHDYVVSRYAPVKSLTTDEYEGLFVGMEEAASSQLQREGFTTDEIVFSRSADLRYRGQWFELNVPMPDRPGSLDEIDALFRRTHLDRFQVDMDRPTEFVNLRVAAQGLVAKPSISIRAGLAPPSSHTREVVFDGQIMAARVLDRFELPSGFEFVGPAIVEEPGATTVVSPGFRVVVHESGALFLEA